MEPIYNLMHALYGKLLVNPMPAVLAFIGIFTIICCVIGFRSRVLSPLALANTRTTLFILCFNALFAPFVAYFSDVTEAAYDSMGIPAVNPAFWEGVPWPLVVLIAFVTADFVDYWSHRVMHTPLFWPLHAIHHSDSHVNGITTYRVHLFEVMLMVVFRVVFASWLGIPPEYIAAAFIVSSLLNAYVHFEVDIDHGWFNWLIASPRFHRWHHADVPEVYGKNLANSIPAWDILFGTYYAGGRCDAQMGAAQAGVPDTNVVKLMILPLELWYGLARSTWQKLTGLRVSQPLRDKEEVS